MSDYTVVAVAAESLRQLLDLHITSTTEPVIGGIGIDLRSPHELELVPVTGLVSLWLYHMQTQPDLANLTGPRLSETERSRQPLPVELWFLATPVHDDARTQLLLAGRIAQVVNDHPRLAGPDLAASLAGSSAQLRLRVASVTAADVGSIWLGMQTYRRLTVPIHLQGVTIDSHRPLVTSSPVLTRDAHTSSIVDVN